MLKRLISRQTVLPVLALTALLSFQNCGQDPQGNNGSVSSSSYESGLPFAYKTSADTLAYMSCENMATTGYDQDQYFTFRMGAYAASGEYSTTGVSMTDTFRSAVANYSLTERAGLFATSDVNLGMIPLLTVQKPNDLQSYYTGSDDIVAGRTVDQFLPELDSPAIAGPLGALPAGMSRAYFPGADDQRFFEASLRFSKAGDEPQSAMRGYFNVNTVLLVSGFTSDLTDRYMHTPVDYPDSQTTALPTGATANNTIYGTGYQLSFTEPTAIGYSNTNAQVLGSVTEKDLVTKAAGNGWTCPTNLQFVIVRPEDAATKCPVSYDNAANAADADAIQKLRRVLRTEYWWINTTYRCVVPKLGADHCYGGAVPTYSGACTGASCPHFVSVCLRN